MPKFDYEKVKQGVESILIGIGEDPKREGLKDTPKRVASFWKEFISKTETKHAWFSSRYDQMIVITGITFFSMCEHHLLPFQGTVSVGYLPKNGKVVGLSKIARIVEEKSKALQIQERLTQEIAEEVEKITGCSGVGVVIEAEHLCMSIRGIKKPHHKTITSEIKGVFRSSQKTKDEFLRLARRKEND